MIVQYSVAYTLRNEYIFWHWPDYEEVVSVPYLLVDQFLRVLQTGIPKIAAGRTRLPLVEPDSRFSFCHAGPPYWYEFPELGWLLCQSQEPRTYRLYLEAGKSLRIQQRQRTLGHEALGLPSPDEVL